MKNAFLTLLDHITSHIVLPVKQNMTCAYVGLNLIGFNQLYHDIHPLIGLQLLAAKSEDSLRHAHFSTFKYITIQKFHLDFNIFLHNTH